MHERWLQDLESLEAISQDDETRRIFLRMAAIAQAGTMPSFLVSLEDDEEVDEATKDSLTELAQDPTFLLVVEDYLRRTQRYH